MNGDGRKYLEGLKQFFKDKVLFLLFLIIMLPAP
jgi:hypothetical protein